MANEEKKEEEIKPESREIEEIEGEPWMYDYTNRRVRLKPSINDYYVWLPSARIGDAVTNYANFADDGELTLFGTARVLKSIPIDNANLGKGSTAPSQVIIGNYNSWEFTINDDSVFTFHLPHDWALGTDVTVQIDWYIDEAGGDEIKWKIDWAATPHNATEAIDAPTHTGSSDTGDIVIPATAKFFTKNTLTIPGGDLSAEDQVGVKASRIAITGGTNPGNDPAIIDIHIIYTADKLGEAT